MSVNGVPAVGNGGDDELRKKKLEQHAEKQKIENVFSLAANQHYLDNKEAIDAALTDEDPNNDSRYIEFEKNDLGIKGMSIQYSKAGDLDGDGVDDVQYTFTVDQAHDLDGINDTQVRRGQTKHITSEMRQQYQDCIAKLNDPRKEVRKQAETDLEKLLDDIYRPLTQEVNGRTFPLYTEKQLKKLKKGIIKDTKATLEFNNTTMFANEHEFNAASKMLKKEQAEAQKRFDEAIKAGKEPDKKDVATLNKQCKMIPTNQALYNFMSEHPEEFYDEDGKFSSDKYKHFAKTLCGDDATLTVQERGNNSNRLMMKANDKQREAQRRLDAVNAAQRRIDDGTASEEDLKLVPKTREEYEAAKKRIADGKAKEGDEEIVKTYDSWKADDELTREGMSSGFLGLRGKRGHLQRVIVKSTGLNADYDYRPLVTIGSIALGVAASAAAANLASKLVKVDNRVLSTVEHVSESPMQRTVLENGRIVIAESTATAITETVVQPFTSGLFEALAATAGAGFVSGYAAGALAGKPSGNAKEKLDNMVEDAGHIIEGSGTVTNKLTGQGTVKDECENCTITSEGTITTEKDKLEDCEKTVTFDIGFGKAKNPDGTLKTKQVTVNGETKTVQVYKARQMWQFWDSFTTNVLDENGNLQLDSEGKPITRHLTKEEKRMLEREYRASKDNSLGKGAWNTKEHSILQCFTLKNGLEVKFDRDYYMAQPEQEYTMVKGVTSAQSNKQSRQLSPDKKVAKGSYTRSCDEKKGSYNVTGSTEEEVKQKVKKQLQTDGLTNDEIQKVISSIKVEN